MALRETGLERNESTDMLDYLRRFSEENEKQLERNDLFRQKLSNAIETKDPEAVESLYRQLKRLEKQKASKFVLKFWKSEKNQAFLKKIQTEENISLYEDISSFVETKDPSEIEAIHQALKDEIALFKLRKYWNNKKIKDLLEQKQEKDNKCCIFDDVSWIIETRDLSKVSEVCEKVTAIVSQLEAVKKRQAELREKAKETGSAYEGKPALKVVSETQESQENKKLSYIHLKKLKFIAGILHNPNNREKLAKSKNALYGELLLAIEKREPEQIDLAHERLEKLVNRKKTSQATPKKPQKAILPKKEEPESAVVSSAVVATEPTEKIAENSSVNVAVVSDGGKSQKSSFSYLDHDYLSRMGRDAEVVEEGTLSEEQEVQLVNAQVEAGVKSELENKGINVGTAEKVIIQNFIGEKSKDVEGMTVKGKIAVLLAVVLAAIVVFQAVGSFFTGKKGKDAEPSKYFKTGGGGSALVEKGNMETTTMGDGVKAITNGKFALVGSTADEPTGNVDDAIDDWFNEGTSDDDVWEDDENDNTGEVNVDDPEAVAAAKARMMAALEQKVAEQKQEYFDEALSSINKELAEIEAELEEIRAIFERVGLDSDLVEEAISLVKTEGDAKLLNDLFVQASDIFDKRSKEFDEGIGELDEKKRVRDKYMEDQLRQAFGSLPKRS